MIRAAYRWLYRALARADERPDSSGGLLQRLVRDAALELLPDGPGRIADIGCGEGLLLARIAARRADLEPHGIDRSGEMLRRAAARLGRVGAHAVLRVADAGRTPFPDGYFDVICCLNMTLMAGSPAALAATVAEFARICRPGGALLIDFRRALLPLEIKYRLAPLYDPSLETRRPRLTLTARAARALLAGQGFAVEHELARGFPFAPFAPLLVMRARRAGVPRG